jgi:hypothetical protein
MGEHCTLYIRHKVYGQGCTLAVVKTICRMDRRFIKSSLDVVLSPPFSACNFATTVCATDSISAPKKLFLGWRERERVRRGWTRESERARKRESTRSGKKGKCGDLSKHKSTGRGEDKSEDKGQTERKRRMRTST